MKLFEFVVSIPKSVYLNFSQLPLRQAIKLPVLVSWRTKFKSLKGRMYIQGKVRMGQVRIGISGTGSGTALFKPTVIENNGCIVFDDGVRVGGGGCQICTTASNSKLVIGKGTRLAGECHMIASESINIGSYCAISWNTQIMDKDFHPLLENGHVVNNAMPIEIGDHVWIASNVFIFKGARIPNNTVVAACSVINSRCDDIKENSVITGLPVRIIKSNVKWEM